MLDNLYLPTSNDQWLCIIQWKNSNQTNPPWFFFVDEIRTKRIKILKFVPKQILAQFKTFHFIPTISHLDFYCPWPRVLLHWSFYNKSQTENKNSEVCTKTNSYAVRDFSFHPYHQSSWFLLPLAWGPLQNLMKQFTDLSTTQVRQRIKIVDLKMTLYFMSKGFEAYNHSYVHTVVCSTLIYLYSFYGYICGLLNLKLFGVKGWGPPQFKVTYIYLLHEGHEGVTWKLLRDMFETQLSL